MYADKLLGPVKQWGYLVKDLDEAMQCWVDQLGVGPWWGFRNVPMQSSFGGEVSEVIIDVALAYQNGVQIELIHQTNDATSPYSQFYGTDKRQELHQVAYHAHDIDSAIAGCKARGMREVGSIMTPINKRYVYMDSPAMEGLVIELMEVDEDAVAEFERSAIEARDWQGDDPYRIITL